MRPDSNNGKQYCPGSGRSVHGLEVRPRWQTDASENAHQETGDLLVQCPECERILVPTKTGKLMKHQRRSKKTASQDRTRETLWAHAYDGQRRNDMPQPSTTPSTVKAAAKKTASKTVAKRGPGRPPGKKAAAKKAASNGRRTRQESQAGQDELFIDLEARFEKKLQAAVKGHRWDEVSELSDWYQLTLQIFPEAHGAEASPRLFVHSKPVLGGSA